MFHEHTISLLNAERARSSSVGIINQEKFFNKLSLKEALNRRFYNGQEFRNNTIE